MGISIISNFDVKTNKPIDSRMVADYLTDIPFNVRYEGLECYTKKSTDKFKAGLYKLVGGISDDNWTLIPYAKDYMPLIGGTFTGEVQWNNDGNDNNVTINENQISVFSDRGETLINDGDISLYRNGSYEILSLKDYIDNIVVASNGLRYKGKLQATTTSPGIFTPAGVVGDLYVVSSDGYINGIKVEVGDWVVCCKDTDAATSTTYSTIVSNWDYIQTNLTIMEGATTTKDGKSGIVPTPPKGVNGRVLKSQGTWGVIQESEVENLVGDLDLLAPKNNPTFTGTVTLPSSDPANSTDAVNKKYADYREYIIEIPINSNSVSSTCVVPSGALIVSAIYNGATFNENSYIVATHGTKSIMGPNDSTSSGNGLIIKDLYIKTTTDSQIKVSRNGNTTGILYIKVVNSTIG